MITLILNDIRSAHNVGSIFRTAECLGVRSVICCGITPYPIIKNDQRLPHIQLRAGKQIAKTALGTEDKLEITHCDNLQDAKEALQGLKLIALEQTNNSISLLDYRLTEDIALVLGNEPKGISPEDLTLCDQAIEIPMWGTKESFNVSVAAGIALFTILS